MLPVLRRSAATAAIQQLGATAATTAAAARPSPTLARSVRRFVDTPVSEGGFMGDDAPAEDPFADFDEAAVKRFLRNSPTETRTQFVMAFGRALDASAPALFAANLADCEAYAEQAGSGEAADAAEQARAQRMYLTPQRYEKVMKDLGDLVVGTDWNNSMNAEWETENRVGVKKSRTPLGRIAVLHPCDSLYAIRALALCVFTGNAVTLKTPSALPRTTAAVVAAAALALAEAEIPRGAVGTVETRAEFAELVAQARLNAGGGGGSGGAAFHPSVDAVISAGSPAAQAFARQTSGGVPLIPLAPCVTVAYVHRDAEPVQVRRLMMNAKVQEPESPAAVDHLLVHREYAKLDELLEELVGEGVTLVTDPRSHKGLDAPDLVQVEPKGSTVFREQFQGLTMTVRLVSAVEEAAELANELGSHHADCVMTKRDDVAEEFAAAVDASMVLHNTSPLLADTEGMALGTGLGVSTGSFVRGPIGAKELFSNRYRISSIGRTRPKENMDLNPAIAYGANAA